MPTPLEQLTEIQTQVIETIAKLQEPVVDLVGKVAERAEAAVPELTSITLPEQMPSVEDVIGVNFEFATKLLEQQRDFALALVAAFKPVTLKVVNDEGKSSKSTKSTKAA